jgi:hypothetical protein
MGETLFRRGDNGSDVDIERQRLSSLQSRVTAIRKFHDIVIVGRDQKHFYKAKRLGGCRERRADGGYETSPPKHPGSLDDLNCLRKRLIRAWKISFYPARDYQWIVGIDDVTVVKVVGCVVARNVDGTREIEDISFKQNIFRIGA